MDVWTVSALTAVVLALLVSAAVAATFETVARPLTRRAWQTPEPAYSGPVGTAAQVSAPRRSRASRPKPSRNGRARPVDFASLAHRRGRRRERTVDHPVRPTRTAD